MSHSNNFILVPKNVPKDKEQQTGWKMDSHLVSQPKKKCSQGHPVVVNQSLNLQDMKSPQEEFPVILTASKDCFEKRTTCMNRITFIHSKSLMFSNVFIFDKIKKDAHCGLKLINALSEDSYTILTHLSYWALGREREIEIIYILKNGL